MAENKTKATDGDVAGYLAAIADPVRRQDCEVLTGLMARATGEPPVLWGTAIVGFGSRHYRTESGREGDICPAGFASRKGDISVYLSNAFPERAPLLAKLGRHKTAKACLYIRRLADIDLQVLEDLVRAAVAQRRPDAGVV